jgi:hypothetical protein
LLNSLISSLATSRFSNSALHILFPLIDLPINLAKVALCHHDHFLHPSEQQSHTKAWLCDTASISHYSPVFLHFGGKVGSQQNSSFFPQLVIAPCFVPPKIWDMDILILLHDILHLFMSRRMCHFSIFLHLIKSYKHRMRLRLSSNFRPCRHNL